MIFIHSLFIMKHTVSYAHFSGGSDAIDSDPHHFDFEAKNDAEKRIKVTELIDSIYKKICDYLIAVKQNHGCEPDDWDGPTSCDYYWKDYMREYRDEIVDSLMKRGYWVWNRYEKYYVVAFALDFTKFEVYSKDCDKRLIEWRKPEPVPEPNVPKPISRGRHTVSYGYLNDLSHVQGSPWNYEFELSDDDEP